MVIRSKLAISMGALAALVLISGGVFLWLQSRSARGLGIKMEAPEQVLIGVPFDLRVNVSNDSGNILKAARLSVDLPEEIVFLGSPSSKKVEYKDLGNIGPGGLTQEVFRLIVLSGENSVKKINASVEFLPSSLGARFEKEESFSLSVGGFGLALDVFTPAKVFSGEDFNIEIAYKNASENDYRNLELVVDYPPSFNFIKADLAPDNSNRDWRLGDLRKGSEGKLKISGNLIGSDDTIFDVKISIQTSFLGETYIINSRIATLAISPSPLSLKIIFNNDQERAIFSGDSLSYSLNYTNKTNVGLRDVVIKAQLIGLMFDLSRLATRANFRSMDQTLIWNAANTPELSLIPAGASGSVDFDLRVKPDFPIRRLSDKNFVLKVNAEIESPTVPEFVAANRTVGIARSEIKVAGQTQIDARAYFRDADAGIVNQGPFPPRVEKATNYIIHWRITNFSTDVSSVEVKAFLGPNVRMTNVVKSNIGSSPIYNDRTQEIIWKVDKILATRGVISDPIESIFQIEATPSQATGYWPLIGETTLTANDDFTGEVLASRDFAITTSLPDDLTINSQQGIVVQ